MCMCMCVTCICNTVNTTVVIHVVVIHVSEVYENEMGITRLLSRRVFVISVWACSVGSSCNTERRLRTISSLQVLFFFPLISAP